MGHLVARFGRNQPLHAIQGRRSAATAARGHRRRTRGSIAPRGAVVQGTRSMYAPDWRCPTAHHRITICALLRSSSRQAVSRSCNICDELQQLCWLSAFASSLSGGRASPATTQSRQVQQRMGHGSSRSPDQHGALLPLPPRWSLVAPGYGAHAKRPTVGARAAGACGDAGRPVPRPRNSTHIPDSPQGGRYPSKGYALLLSKWCRYFTSSRLPCRSRDLLAVRQHHKEDMSDPVRARGVVVVEEAPQVNLTLWWSCSMMITPADCWSMATESSASVQMGV